MRASKIAKILEEVRHWLPQQQPISVFIHHNTLHALEHMTFEDAVEYSAARRGSAPYLPLEKYQSEFKRGRIDERHVSHALEEFLAAHPDENTEYLGGKLNSKSVYRAAMQAPVCTESDAAIKWRISDEKLSTAYFAAIEKKCTGCTNSSNGKRSARHPELLRQTAVDTMMIRLAAAFLDQGVSYWPMPRKERESFLRAAVTIFSRGDDQLPANFRWFDSDFKWQDCPLDDVLQLIEILLGRLNIPEADWEHFIFEEVMQLPGWAGAMDYFGSKFASGQTNAPNGSLEDFVAVRLLLRNSRLARPEAENVPKTNGKSRWARVYNIYKFLNEVSIASGEWSRFPTAEVTALCTTLERFGDVERRRVWHNAFERHFRCQILDGLIANVKLNKNLGSVDGAKYQAVFCIDEREESMRRHIEEVSPQVATYGTAGFFGMDMFYQGIHDHGVASLCPIVLTPKHQIREVATARAKHKASSTSSRLAVLRKIGREIYDNSRTVFVGQLLTVIGGFFAAVPLFFKILMPSRSAKLVRKITEVFPGKLETELHFEQDISLTGSDLQPVGYKISEMGDRVAGTLRSMGLVKDFTKLVFFFGHGSSSVNNPHKSAYDCGACGGSRGGPNARVFAAAANHPKVREHLRTKGIDISSATYFVGGFHDTSSDSLEFSDTYNIPASHQDDFINAKKIFDEARKRNAHERCRRFEDAMNLSPSAALRHVESRAVSLREPRPECGHATNAVCIIGRREMTKHLFLDRRSFLVSYDPTIDPNGDILAGVMGPIIPVCGGINLEYYFSFIDNQIYGSGTKLPHNVTGLIGIIDGHASDLRTGLPWQMVEIHEPMRLVIIMETTRPIAEDMLKRNALLKQYVALRWVQFGFIDFNTGQVEWFEGDGFKTYKPLNEDGLQEASNSRGHYSGTLLHLPPVRIASGALRDGLH